MLYCVVLFLLSISHKHHHYKAWTLLYQMHLFLLCISHKHQLLTNESILSYFHSTCFNSIQYNSVQELADSDDCSSFFSFLRPFFRSLVGIQDTSTSIEEINTQLTAPQSTSQSHSPASASDKSTEENTNFSKKENILISTDNKMSSSNSSDPFLAGKVKGAQTAGNSNDINVANQSDTSNSWGSQRPGSDQINFESDDDSDVDIEAEESDDEEQKVSFAFVDVGGDGDESDEDEARPLQNNKTPSNSAQGSQDSIPSSAAAGGKGLTSPAGTLTGKSGKSDLDI